MTHDPTAHYGVRETSSAVSELDAHAEELRLIGCTVLPGEFDAGTIASLRKRITLLIERQESEFGGRDALARIGEEDTGRALLAYDEAFLSLVANDRLLGLVERMLGPFFVLAQQNSVSLPSHQTHHQAQYHRDLPYQHFTSSRPLAISALYCADAFTEENGATWIIPGSHKFEPFPSTEAVQRLARPVTAPEGSFIVFDAMLFHRAGENRSDAIRRGVNHVFVLPFMRQQIDLPAMLNGRFADDPRLRRLLGYESRTPMSVLDYRRERLDKLSKTKI